MSIAEAIWQKVISDLMKIKTVRECWPVWQKEIRKAAGTNPKASSLIDLHLAPVFWETRRNRDQSGISAGGTAWEALVTWYLNLCLIGTRAVVIRNASACPRPISDALTVTHGNVETRKESDLVAITFPPDPELDGFDKKVTKSSKKEIETKLSSLFAQTEVCVIQCKTNWNDNAQIPMLWNLVYSAAASSKSKIPVGKNGFKIGTLQRFAYAFITVPSNKLENFKPTSMTVRRCADLTGGNYWGLRSKAGIARAIPDIFHRNFETAISEPTDWRAHLDEELKLLNSKYSYFNY